MRAQRSLQLYTITLLCFSIFVAAWPWPRWMPELDSLIVARADDKSSSSSAAGKNLAINLHRLHTNILKKIQHLPLPQHPPLQLQSPQTRLHKQHQKQALILHQPIPTQQPKRTRILIKLPLPDRNRPALPSQDPSRDLLKLQQLDIKPTMQLTQQVAFLY